ncbi:hypothetical protein OIU85_018965 [Salix viminalis]|uniref:DUF632 domain-containing protein n=1 Tax=Salix viminalis TaxID=40686 RepID=A0A9Q0UV79_SALVM|nr:hypothetical protein OIU85_018965 [Salix viminalis]
MYESHQVQTHIVQQLKYLNPIPSTEPTSEIHRQSTLQLEFEAGSGSAFSSLAKTQFPEPVRNQEFTPFAKSGTMQLIEFLTKWHLKGIKSFLTVIHAIVVQQAEEHKQKKKSESAFKEFEKKVAELRSLESKYGPYSMPETSSTTRNKDPVAEKRAKVEILRAKAEEEKSKHEKLISVTRSMTTNNLQMGFPHAFQAMVGFSSVCMNAFESIFNQAKNADQEHV